MIGHKAAPPSRIWLGGAVFFAEQSIRSILKKPVGICSRTKDEVSQSDFKTAGILQKAGVKLALTTDHPVTRIQYLPLCAMLAVKEGMDEWAALRAITIDAARICRVNERLGSLKPGKDADLVIFDGKPLELAATLRTTIINGEIVWQN